MKVQSRACDDDAQTGFKRLISIVLNMKMCCRHGLGSDIKRVQVTDGCLKI